MIDKAKTEEVTETFLAWPSRTIGILTSMPLSLKLGLLVLITLIPRLLAFLQPQIITIDGTLYIKMAKLFSEGKYAGISNTYFNLYPLMIFVVQKIVGDWELSGLLISITLGTLTVIPVFLLGRSLYNEKLGWLSALFYITLPNFLKFDANVLKDPTYWFFMALALYLAWDGIQKNRLILFGFASISAGLGALTRVDGFVLWGILAFYALCRKVPGVSIRRRVLNLTVLIVVFPLFLSPALFSMRKFPSQRAFGEMVSYPFDVIKDKTRMILHPLDPIDAMGQKTYDSLPMISQDSLELASRHRIALAISEVIHKFIKSANLLIVFILLGLWKRKREGFESSDGYLLCVFGALSIMSVFYTRQIYYFSTRAGLTLVLPCVFFAGHGLDSMAERLSLGINRFTSGWSFVKKYLLHIITTFLIMVFLAQGISFKRTEKFVQKEIGFWLKEKGYQGSVIMGPKKFLRLAFYADGKFVELPDSWEKVKDSIHNNKVKIIVIDTLTIEQECPGFLENLSQVGLFPLHSHEGKKGITTIEIFRVH